MQTRVSLVGNPPTDTSFIHCKSFHGPLHPIKACTLPHKVNTETMIHINRNSLQRTMKIRIKNSSNFTMTGRNKTTKLTNETT